MHKPHTSKAIRKKSEEARRRVNIRWQRDRERRQAIADLNELDPLLVLGRILQRVVVITNESTCVEIIRRTNTSQREWARLKRTAGL